MRQFTRIFLRGLLATLPIFLTLYLVIWSLAFLESALSGVLKAILPENLYIPGMGLIFLIGGIFLAGLALSENHVQKVFNYVEKRFSKLPIIKSIYGICKDFLEYFAGQQERKKFNQVVTVKMPQWDFKIVGFITERDLSRHNDQLAENDDWIAVYLPMGYQIGGYTLLMDRRRVEPIDMSFEDAMRFILTAGVASNHEEDTAPPFATPAPPHAEPETKPKTEVNDSPAPNVA